MVLCPVCKTKLRTNTKKCSTCGFNDLRVEFLNSDEAEHWKQKIVAPYKKKYAQSHKKKTTEIPKISKTRKTSIHIENGKVFFGKYHQSKDGKSEPISWLVIKDAEDKILLLSEKCLDVIPFYNVKNTYDYDYFTWFGSGLRSWLNTDFYNEAFSGKEKAQILSYEFEETTTSYRSKSYKYIIKDNVFVLSAKEVPICNCRCEPTEYAKTKGLKAYNPNKYSYWWLRDVINSNALVVRPGGEIDKRGFSVNSGFGTTGFSFMYNTTNEQGHKIGVRPAIWIKK